MANVKDDEEDNEHEVEDEMEDIGYVESDDEVINVAKIEPVDDSEVDKINLSLQLVNLIKQSPKNRDLWDKIRYKKNPSIYYSFNIVKSSSEKL